MLNDRENDIKTSENIIIMRENMTNNSLIKSSPRYLGLVELYHKKIHGFYSSDCKELLNNYIVFCSKNFLLNESDCQDEYSSAGEYYDPADAALTDTESDTESETDSEIESNTDNTSNQGFYLSYHAIINEFEYLKSARRMCLSGYKSIEKNNGKPLTRKSIRNYQKIIKSQSYLQPEIFEKVYIDERCCAIIKTFWIRIVQRSWKRIFKERVKIKALRRIPSAIMHWQRTNRWPDDCAYMPGIRHMIHLPNKF
jgi:hypothetical protein